MRKNPGSWFLAAAAALGLGLTACSNGTDTTSGPATLTLWHNYGTTAAATATTKLVQAFEKLHPNIKIQVRSQPSANYFPLLQAANISRNGPDLAVMWTGLYTIKYKNMLTNLRGMIPDENLKRVSNLQWTAEGFDAKNGPLVMPLEAQFYMGFYNKSLFAKAGIATPPRTWNELFSACDKLKKTGVVPIEYGQGWAVGAQFYPWYDVSYLLSSIYTPDQWRGLYTGATPWRSPAISAQLTKWAQLFKNRCTNSDVITKADNLKDFTSQKAAMVIDGTWNAAQFQKEMGDKVAAFIPPFSDTPASRVVYYNGDGFSITKYSKQKKAAALFLDFMTTPQGQQTVADAGLIPDNVAYKSPDGLTQQMLDFVQKDKMTAYPMLDNMIQPEVVEVGNKTLPSVLAGQTTPGEALGQMEKALNALPDSRRTNFGQ